MFLCHVHTHQTLICSLEWNKLNANPNQSLLIYQNPIQHSVSFVIMLHDEVGVIVLVLRQSACKIMHYLWYCYVPAVCSLYELLRYHAPTSFASYSLPFVTDDPERF